MDSGSIEERRKSEVGKGVRAIEMRRYESIWTNREKIRDGEMKIFESIFP